MIYFNFVFNTLPSVWNRAQAESDFHDFLEQIVPSGGTDTSIFSIQDYGKHVLCD